MTRRQRSVRDWGRGAARTLLLLLPLVSAAPAAATLRVASLNVCSDQLVLMLADREEIASLSYYAADPSFSQFADQAGGIPTNRGQAEELLAAEPTLVVGGTFSNPATQELLARLGIPVLPLDVPTDFAAIRAQVLSVARALGHPERGEELVAELDRRLAALESRLPERRPLAAVYQENGITPAKGTLIDAVIAAAGLENLGSRLGLSGYAALSLEDLALSRPALLIHSVETSDAPSLARQVLRHPALEAVSRHALRITVPASLWVCPGPYTVQAAELLAAARDRVLTGAPAS
jgi:iron complex transport system substrate-binding protein